jgi:hypothetical protein
MFQGYTSIECAIWVNVLIQLSLEFMSHRVSPGLENPGKSLNWKKIPALESP